MRFEICGWLGELKKAITCAMHKTQHSLELIMQARCIIVIKNSCVASFWAIKWMSNGTRMCNSEFAKRSISSLNRKAYQRIYAKLMINKSELQREMNWFTWCIIFIITEIRHKALHDLDFIECIWMLLLAY
jgi:hypothetical protein